MTARDGNAARRLELVRPLLAAAHHIRLEASFHKLVSPAPLPPLGFARPALVDERVAVDHAKALLNRVDYR